MEEAVHNLGIRLRAWRERENLSQKDAAAHFGVPSRTYQDYERGLKAPGARAIESFVRKGINANWLLTGEGLMLVRPSATGPSPGGCGPPAVGLPSGAAGPGFTTFPLYDDVRAFAGHGTSNEEDQAENVVMLSDDWIRRELGAIPRNLFMIRVTGDSMEPTLRIGDLLLVDRQASCPDREGVYLLRLGEMFLVRRLQALPGGKIRVTSDNAAFDPFIFDANESGDDVRIHGRIIWTGRRL
jgi:phage repressor protein C with HTH and peptisase S24 domain